MLTAIACIFGIFALLVISEILWMYKILKGEDQRKFVHITVGTFIAFWPWLLSYKAIAFMGLALLAIILVNRWRIIFHFRTGVNRETYGDIFFALVITFCALISTPKIFFTLAILHMSLADGFAAVIGQKYGKQWRYKVFRHTKSVVGSMTFWFVSVCILGTGVLFANGLISYGPYVVLLLLLPPVLTVVENIGILGFDNIFVPLAVLLALRLAQVA